METVDVQADKFFELTQQVIGETSESAILQHIANTARELTRAKLAVAGHGRRSSEGNGQAADPRGVFRTNVASLAPELTYLIRELGCPPNAGGQHLALLRSVQTLRLSERELRAHPAWPLLLEGELPLRGLLAANIYGASGDAEGLLIVSDRSSGDFVLQDEVMVGHLSAIASAHLARLEERERAQTREEEAVARTKRLASRLHQRSERLARLEERHRLAQELHDSVSQSLYAISLSATAASNMLEQDPGRASGMLAFVLAQARAAVTEMRSLVYELRSDALASEGLQIALMRLAEALEARWELRVDLDIQCEPPASLEVKEALYRISQEALRNTARHARASNAMLRLRCIEGAVVIEETDNGVGFDPQLSTAGHAGIEMMRMQATRLGGTCAVKSVPGQGTRIRATIPIGSRSLN